MTYKYQYIRHDIYEKNPASKLKSYRSLKVMAQLFKLPYWILIGITFCSLVSLLILTIINPYNKFMLIPMIVIFLVYMIIPIIREKFIFNDSARTDELSDRNKNYNEYISEVKSILTEHGIDSSEKLINLKTECETAIKTCEDKYSKINSKIIDMLIGVPLGALVASIIYKNNDAVPASIVAIIVIGLSILGIAQLIRIIQYYSEGYFKDKYLLDAINELEYSKNT